MILCPCKDFTQKMSVEAKIPHNDCDWKTIDIYVFNNGQQLSPPRKYHIESEELSWWDATLKLLAKTQYGSLYSMVDLYTIKGEKIENPLLLSNGSAYVAVKPKDSFVNTGYERYLVKASRSWEKSQARRNSVEKKSEDIQNISIIYPANETDNIESDLHLIKEAIDSIQQPNTETKFSTINDSIVLRNGMNTQKSKKNNFKRPMPSSRVVGKTSSTNNKKEPILNGTKRNSKSLVRTSEKGSKLFNMSNNQCKKIKLLKDVCKENSIETPLDIPITIHVTNQDKETSTTQLISISHKSLITDENIPKEEQLNNRHEINNTNNSKCNLILSGPVMNQEHIRQQVPSKVVISNDDLLSSNTEAVEETNLIEINKLTTEINQEHNQHEVLRKVEVTKDLPSHNKENSNKEAVVLRELSNIQLPLPNTNSYTIINNENEGAKEKQNDTINQECNKPIELHDAIKSSLNGKEENSQTNTEDHLIPNIVNNDSVYIDKILAEYRSQFVFHEYVFAIPQNFNSCFCSDDRKYIILLPKERNASDSKTISAKDPQETTDAKRSTENENPNTNNLINAEEANKSEPPNKDERSQNNEQKSTNNTPIKEIYFKELKQNAKQTGNEHVKLNKSTQTEWCGVLLESKINEDGRRTFHFPGLDLIKIITNKT